MSRRFRIESPGAIYHVLTCGDRREPIFMDDQYRKSFVEALTADCARSGWPVHACVLRPNHLHLVSRRPSPSSAPA